MTGGEVGHGEDDGYGDHRGGHPDPHRVPRRGQYIPPVQAERSPTPPGSQPAEESPVGQRDRWSNERQSYYGSHQSDCRGSPPAEWHGQGPAVANRGIAGQQGPPPCASPGDSPFGRYHYEGQNEQQEGQGE